MKTEVIAWGDVESKIREIGVAFRECYIGDWSREKISVFEVEEDDLDKLFDQNNDWSDVDGCIRWAKGSSLGRPYETLKIDGKEIFGWVSRFKVEDEDDEEEFDYTFDKLSDYLEWIGVTSYRNVTAALVEMALGNDCSVSDLLDKYQGKNHIN